MGEVRCRMKKSGFFYFLQRALEAKQGFANSSATQIAKTSGGTGDVGREKKFWYVVRVYVANEGAPIVFI